MTTMEHMDTQVYDALKANFETIMLRMVTKAKDKDNGDWVKDFDLLRDTFNARVDDSLTMLARIRKLEAEKGKADAQL